MRRPRAGPFAARGRGRPDASGKGRALNAYQIDKEDVPKETADIDDLMDQSEEEGVKSEDDEDIDSDEAFGESDEERYTDFTFRGSSGQGGKVKLKFDLRAYI
jgi:U3 small nucleolar RNA-associated protein 14